MKRRPLLTAFVLWISVDWFTKITTPPKKAVIRLSQYLTRKAGKP